MKFILNFRKIFKKNLLGRKEIIVIISAIVLTTVGIKASDNFFNSNDLVIQDKSRCPINMVFVFSENGGFCIDKYEASPNHNCPYNNPLSQSQTRINLDDPHCYSDSRADAIPWRNISQNQAAMACAKAGKRLPTNKEWLQAALGTPDHNSGWGSDDCHVSNNWQLQPGLTGSGKNCVSSVGAYDMIGNVWEWVDGTIFNGIYNNRQLPKQGFVKSIDEDAIPNETDQKISDLNYYEDYFWIKSKGTRGISRGGYWNNKSDAGQYAVYMVTSPAFTGVGIGFRCVK